ncbi:MAG: hypothetical protein HOM11_02940, partial [Methylococcales bacterium]|nr:hypothetical protein [Methylococcales bacterium]
QLDPPDAGNLLQLTSAEQPIPVKKQFKYNISRWAVTGRDDVNLNTRCYQFLQAILADEKLDTLRNWRQLCDLWSSDFRTHITQRRWMLFQRKLTRFALKLGVKEPQVGIGIAGADWLEVNESCQLNGFDLTLNKEMHSLTVKGENVHLELNLWRGLAIQTLAFASHDFQPSIGTLHHGYFDSIALGADFYSATTVIELVESHSRLTDLVPVDVFMAECEQGIMLQSQVMTQLGSLTKTYTISKTESVTYTLEFSFTERPRGVVRVGNFTLVSNPSDAKRWYRVKNGGTQFEQFELGAHCAHCEPASTLVTARTGLGATSGEIQIGDKDHALSLTWNPADCAAFPMVCHEVHDKNALTRVVFSLSELDETSIQGGRLLPFEVTLKPLVNHD